MAENAPTRRRTLVLGGALATGAAAAGLGLALWREGARRTATAEPPPAHPDTAMLWGHSFPRPDETALVLASLRGKPLLVNFWATWCPPCVKEMPEFDRFHRDYAGRGWQVLGLAIDSPSKVREFLQRVPVSYEIALAGFAGSELSRQLGNTQGALPFTVLVAADGRIAQRHLGETNYENLARWAATL